MGRPAKNNAEYFPHYGSTRNHRKVKVLRNKFGNVLGYAFWCLMLEWLTEQDGLEWEYSEIECEMFAAELGVSAAEIPPLIDFCLKIELLFKTESGFIYSESLNENLAAVFEKRKRERDKSKTRKRRENGVFVDSKPTSGGVSAAEIPQSKVKEIKVDNSKEDNNKKGATLFDFDEKKESDSKEENPEPVDNTSTESQQKASHTRAAGGQSYLDQFRLFHTLYPSDKRRGAETEFNNLEKKWGKEFPGLFEVLHQALVAEHEYRNYMQIYKPREFLESWPHMQTYLNQRRWEIKKETPAKLISEKQTPQYGIKHLDPNAPDYYDRLKEYYAVSKAS